MCTKEKIQNLFPRLPTQFKSKQSITSIPVELLNKKTQKDLKLIEETTLLYKIYMQLLLGQEMNKEEEQFFQSRNKTTQIIDQNFTQYDLPEVVISLNNPDQILEDQKFIQLPQEEIFKQITQSLYLNDKSIEDKVFFKAIESVFCLLLDQKIDSNIDLKTNGPDSSQPLGSPQSLFSNDHQKNPTNYTIDLQLYKKEENINKFVKNLQNQLLQLFLTQITAGNFNVVESIHIDCKKISSLENKILSQGEYLKQKGLKWYKTSYRTQDVLTLVRNILIVQFSRKGFIVNTSISRDGSKIFLLLYMTERMLEITAENFKLQKKISFSFTDLLSLEPVDKQYRPLRLSRRLWNTDEYHVSPYFAYLRPLIIEQINEINFKRMMREVGQAGIRSELFDYGNLNIQHDQDGPTDEEWSAFYNYLVHLNQQLKYFRSQNKIDNDLALCIDKQKTIEEIIRIRNKLKSSDDIKYFHQNIVEMENEINDLEEETSHIGFFTNLSKLKNIKLVKQYQLAHKYYNLFLEALDVANFAQKLLYNVWERFNQKPLEIYQLFNKTSNDQSQYLKWCRYIKNEENIVTLFPSNERLKLSYLLVNDLINVNNLKNLSFIQTCTCLHDQYELHGCCKNIKFLLQENQFCLPKPFDISAEWKLKLIYPWQIPITRITEYFGERIGLYFEFTSFFMKFTIHTAIIGLLLNIFLIFVQQDQDEVIHTFILTLSSIIFIHWSSFITEFWNKQQSLFNYYHCQIRITKQNEKRKEFKGNQIRSIENDNLNSDNQDHLRMYIRYSILILILIFLMAIDVSIFTCLYYFNFFLKEQLENESKNFENVEIIITSSINYIMQFFLDFIDEKIAIWLADFENFQTISEYEICYIIMKNILFCFSQILPLFIITFLSEPFQLYCQAENCKYQSIYIFATFCVLGFLIQAIRLIRVYKISCDKEKEFRQCKENLNDIIERQDKLMKFSPNLKNEEMIQEFIQFFNFYIMVSLFGCLFPFSLMLFCIFILFHSLIQKFQLLYLYQRPWPLDQAQSKFWNGYLQFINYLAILINTGLVAIYYYHSLQEKIIVVFVCLLFYNFSFKYIFGALFGKVSSKQQQIMKRKKYIEQSNSQIQKINNKSSKKKQLNTILYRFPLYKVFGSSGIQSSCDFETLSSSEEIEEYFKKKGKNISQKLVVAKEMYNKTICDINKNLKLKTVQGGLNQNARQSIRKEPIKMIEKQREQRNKFFLKIQKKISTCTKRIIQVDKLNYNFLHNYFSKRRLNWAFMFQKQNIPSEQIIKTRTKIWKFFFRLNLLSTYTNIWNNRKLHVSQVFMFRKRLILQNLDLRKYLIQKQSYNRQVKFYTEFAGKKFRKQFQKFGNTFTGEELKEYDQLVVKYQNFIQQKSWLNCRKVVLFKWKGVFFNGFRKQHLRKRALKQTLDYYGALTQLELLSQDSLINMKFNNLIKATPINQITFEIFFEILSQINYEPKAQFTLPTGKSRINQKVYHSQSLKSEIYKNVIDKSKDTYIFEQQNQKVEEFAFQYFLDEINQIPNIKLKKHLHDILWIVEIDNKNYLMQFFQIRHGQQLQFQQYYNDNLGIFIGQSQNYIKLLNIIDQIDDFFIKGYCISLYSIGDDECKSMYQVLQFRKKYSLNYTIEELKQFLYANLILLSRQNINNISIYNYILINNEYMILNSIKQSINIIHQLIQVIIEMIVLQPVEDYIKVLQNLQHPLRYLLQDIIKSDKKPIELLDLMIDQKSFQEIDLNYQIKKKDPNKYSQIQTMIHQINFYLRMKKFTQCLQTISEFEIYINEHFFHSTKKQSDIMLSFINKITENGNNYLLKSNKIKLYLDITLVFYFKHCSLFGIKKKEEANLNFLIKGLKKCFNQIKIILKQLSFNVKLENLSDADQRIILQKQIQLTNQQQSSITSFERLELINKLRKNKDCIQSIAQYKRSLKRYINQLLVIQALESYFDRKFILAVAQLNDIIIVQEQLVKNYYPKVDGEPTDHSPGLVNFEQSSPLNEEQLFLDENDLNEKQHPQYDNLYQTQLLYYKFLSLVILYDSKNEQFQAGYNDFISIESSYQPVYKYYSFQLKILAQTELENLLREEDYCEIGKYHQVSYNKWLEIKFQQQNTIINSNDIDFVKYQILFYSDLKLTIENRNLLKSYLAQFKIEKEKNLLDTLLQLRLIQFILHIDNYQPISITVSQQIKKRMKNWLSQKGPTYVSMIQLLQELHKKIHFSYTSWFNHQCLEQTQMFYHLSLCFAYSSKHLENLHNKNIKPLISAMLEIKKFSCKSNFTTQILKSIQINNHYLLNFTFDQMLPDQQQYQLVCQYLNCCIKSHQNFKKSIQIINDQLYENFQPSIIILGLLHSYVTIQQHSMFNLVLQFSKKMLICKSPIFINHHEGFFQDLKVIESIYTNNNTFIPYPFSVLYLPTHDIKYFEDQNFFCSYLLFLMQKFNDNFLIQEILSEQIEIIKHEQKFFFFADLFRIYLQVLETLVGDYYFSDDDKNDTLDYKEGTLIFAIICHFKCKYYLNLLNFQQALIYSEFVLKYINTSLKEQYVTIKLERTTMHYLQTTHPIIKQFFVQSYPQLLEEFYDYELLHLYNNDFINEAILHHLRITINLEINVPSLDLLFQFQLLIENKYQMGYFYLLFAEYFQILIEYDENLLNQYLLISDKKRLKELQQEIKICQSQQSTLYLANQISNEQSSLRYSRLSILEFQLHIYESSKRGFSKQIINNWRTHSANLSQDFFFQVLSYKQLQIHPLIIQLKLIQCESYQQINSLRQSEAMINQAKTGIFGWFYQKNHPLKGLYYYVKGRQNLWLSQHFQKIVYKLIASSHFDDFEIEQLIKDLVKLEPEIIQIFDQYYTLGSITIFQNLDNYLQKKFGQYQKRKYYKNLQRNQASEFLNEIRNQLQLPNLKDLELFQKAKTTFNYFQIDHKCLEIIDFLLYPI